MLRQLEEEIQIDEDLISRGGELGCIIKVLSPFKGIFNVYTNPRVGDMEVMPTFSARTREEVNQKLEIFIKGLQFARDRLPCYTKQPEEELYEGGGNA